MLNLVTRKNLKRLLGYFEGDFTAIGLSNMWDAVNSEIRFDLPPVRTRLKASHRVCSGWSALDKTAFSHMVEAVRSFSVEGGILAYEFALSPPKSVSVAALAGPEIDAKIIEAHLGAVDETLAFLAPLLMDRRQRRFHPAEVKLVRFTHPWNRKTEPQLHSHILLFRSWSRKGRALYGYPFFLHQRPLRAVYHYSLASRLRRAGYAVRTGRPGTMEWELEGISRRTLQRFAERSQGIQQQARDDRDGFFSLAVETRLAILASRRELPKTNANASLITARSLWGEKVRPEDCIPASHSGPVTTELLPVELDTVFRSSSVISKWQFTAIHLAHWIGSPRSLNEAVGAADRWLGQLVRAGDVVERDRGVCYPKGFQTEARILEILERGWSRLAPLTWKLPTAVPKWLARKLNLVAQTADRVRIASLSGETLPKEAQLLDPEQKKVTDAVVISETWDPYVALSELQRRDKGYVVLLICELLRKGDFLQRLERLTPRRSLHGNAKALVWEGTRISVLNQRMADYLERGKGSLLERTFREIRKKLPGGKKSSPSVTPIIYSPATRSDECLRGNWNRLETAVKKQGQGRMIGFGEKLDWETVSSREKWDGIGLFVASDLRLEALIEKLGPVRAKELGTLRHEACWWFNGAVGEGGVIEARGKLRPRTFSFETLKTLMESEWGRDRLHFIIHRDGPLVPGVPLTPIVRFRSGDRLFNPGEILYVKRIQRDGGIVFTDGTRWTAVPCLMQPAYQVTEFPQPERQLKSIPVVLTELKKGDDIFQRLVSMPKCQSLLIFSPAPEKVEEAFREEISRREHRKHDRNARSVLYHSDEENDDRDEFLPSRTVWKNLIEPKRICVDFDLVSQPIEEGPEPGSPVSAPIGGLDPRTASGPETVGGPGELTKKPAKREEVEKSLKMLSPVNHLSLFWLRMFRRQAQIIGKIKRPKPAIGKKPPTTPGPEL